MKATALFSACALSAIFVAGLLAEPPAAQQTQREKKEFRSPEMDGLIKAIHAELIALKKTQPWLKEYDDKCLKDGKWIYYSPREAMGKKGETMPQQPSHISIGYCPINAEKGFKYDNHLEDVRVCQFPTLKAKNYAEILLWNPEDKKTAEAIRKCILEQCEEMQEKMEMRSHVPDA